MIKKALKSFIAIIMVFLYYNLYNHIIISKKLVSERFISFILLRLCLVILTINCEVKIAMDVSNRIELSLQLGKLRKQARDIASLIDDEQKQLLQNYQIPANQQESEKFLNEFRCFQAERYEVKVAEQCI